MALSTLPAPPDPNNRATFEGLAYPWSLAVNTMTTEINNDVIPLANNAIAASTAAISAAAYKGPWASLSGALAIPASVSYSGKIWLLTESVANVAAEVPGVSSKWVNLSAAPQTYELVDTVTATGAAYVEWTNFATLASDYIELQVIGSNLLSNASGRQLTAQLRINNAVQTTSFDGLVIGGASHTQLTGAMSSANSLSNQTNIAMELRMSFGNLGVTAYARAKYETIERNANTFVMGSANSSATPTTPIQGVRILGSAGTITGTFKLYGVRK